MFVLTYHNQGGRLKPDWSISTLNFRLDIISTMVKLNRYSVLLQWQCVTDQVLLYLHMWYALYILQLYCKLSQTRYRVQMKVLGVVTRIKTRVELEQNWVEHWKLADWCILLVCWCWVNARVRAYGHYAHTWANGDANCKTFLENGFVSARVLSMWFCPNFLRNRRRYLLVF